MLDLQSGLKKVVPMWFFCIIAVIGEFVKMYMLVTYRQTITNDSYRNVFTRGQYVVGEHIVLCYLLLSTNKLSLIVKLNVEPLFCY